MYSYITRIVACILLLSHTLMSCQNAQIGLPSPNRTVNENKQYQEEFNIIEDNVDVHQTSHSPHFVLTAANRQIVNFSYEQDTWHASLSLIEIFLEKDNLIKVPVYYGPGYTLEKVATYSVARQRKLVHIMPSEIDPRQPGYVYIGRSKGQQSVYGAPDIAPMQTLPQPLLLENTQPDDLPKSDVLEYSQTQAMVSEQEDIHTDQVKVFPISPGSTQTSTTIQGTFPHRPIHRVVPTVKSKHKVRGKDKRRNIATQLKTPFSVYQQHALQQHTKKEEAKRNQAEEIIQRESVKLEEVSVGNPLTNAVMRTSTVSVIENEPFGMHLSDRQTAIPAYLPGIGRQFSGRQVHYQLALTQKGVDQFLYQLTQAGNMHTLPLIPAIRTRDGHQVNFIQQANHWLALVNENCTPGFSRALALPVLYPVGRIIGQLERQIIHTVESLLTASPDVQKALVHIVFPEKALKKQGYVYTGTIMGLEGGGSVGSKVQSFWRGLGGFIVRGAISVAVAVVVPILCGNLWVGIFAGIGVGLWYYKKYQARERAIKEFEAIAKPARGDCKYAIQQVADISKKIGKQISDSQPAYKNLRITLKEIDMYKSKVQSSLSDLRAWRVKYFEESWLPPFEFNVGNTYSGATSTTKRISTNNEVLWGKDVDRYEKYINYLTQGIANIDNYIQQVRDKCRNQAYTELEKAILEADRKTSKCHEKLHKSITGIAATGLGTLKDHFLKMKKQINNNIGMYTTWKSEPALFDNDKSEIDKYIEKEKGKLTEMQLIENLIGYVEKSDNNLKKLANIVAINPGQDRLLVKYCSEAIKAGQACIIEYLIKYKKMSPNLKNNLGNTPLHQAVLANQPGIVELLFKKYGADETVKNRKLQSPLDLAKDNPTIRKILESHSK